MIRDILEEKVLSRIENSTDQFNMLDSVTYKNVSVTAATTLTNMIYLFAMSTSLSVPVISKIDPKKRWIAKIKICSDLSCIAVFFKDQSFDIYPIDSFVRHAYPTSSHGISEGLAFSSMAISINEDFNPPHREIYHSPIGVTEVVSNVFWYDSSAGILLIVVDLNSVKIWSIQRLREQPVIIPFENVVTSCLRVHKSYAILYCFTHKNMCYAIQIKPNMQSKTAEKRQIPIEITGKPVLVQPAYSILDQKWEIAVLQKDLFLYDQDGHEMKHIPIGEHTRAQPNSFAVTKHFVFYTNGGRVIANFFKNLDNAKSAFLFGQNVVSVLDFQKDIVVCMSGNSITLLGPKQPPDEIFKNLVRKENWKKAFEVCGGFDLSFPRICRNLAFEYIKKGKYHKALQCYKQGDCDTTEIIHRFVHFGRERYAYHCAMEAISDDTPLRSLPKKSLRDIGNLLLQRLFIKFSIFTSFHSWSIRVVHPELALPDPERLVSNTDLNLAVKKEEFSKLTKVPTSLLFRYFKQVKSENGMEKCLSDASKIDLSQPSFSISQGFAALMRQKKRSMCTDAIELTEYPPFCVHLYTNKEQNIKAFICRDGFFINKVRLSKQPDSFLDFAFFNETLYLLTKNHQLIEAPVSAVLERKIIYKTVENIPPVLTMKNNQEKIVFLCINGTIMVQRKDSNEMKSFTGDFIDFCFNNNAIYALDTGGEVSKLWIDSEGNEKIEPFFSAHFIKALACTETYVMLYHSPRKVTIVKNASNDDFDVSFDAFVNEQKVTEKVINFDVECSFSSHDCCLFAGGGHLLIISEDGAIEERNYPQRIGTIFSIAISEENDGFLMCGSSSNPIVVLNTPIEDMKMPLYGDFESIVDQYKPDRVLPLFTNPIFRALFQCLYGMWSTFEFTPKLSVLLQYVPSMTTEQGAELLNILARNDIKIPDDIIRLPCARAMLINHRENMKKLSQEQIKSILQQHEKKPFTGLDQLTERILQNPANYVSIIPRQIEEGTQLTGFSCGHVFNDKEMSNNLSKLTKFLEEKGKKNSVDQIQNQYSKPIIQAQCPKCLLKAIKKRI